EVGKHGALLSVERPYTTFSDGSSMYIGPKSNHPSGKIQMTRRCPGAAARLPRHGNAWRLGANHSGSFAAIGARFGARVSERRSEQAPVSGSRSQQMAVSSVAQQRSPMRF